MDYCTGWFEGWWSDCCMAHDAAYAAQVARDVADDALFQCVAGSEPTLAVASTLVAGLMWAAVRLFGRRFYRKAGEERA
ncbi:membrane protein [Pseudomonas phage ZRG1]|nr:membrane protein [Pseudomonas phage ZRG1]